MKPFMALEETSCNLIKCLQGFHSVANDIVDIVCTNFLKAVHLSALHPYNSVGLIITI